MVIDGDLIRTSGTSTAGWDCSLHPGVVGQGKPELLGGWVPLQMKANASDWFKKVTSIVRRIDVSPEYAAETALSPFFVLDIR
jgi:hypothetical protein